MGEAVAQVIQVADHKLAAALLVEGAIEGETDANGLHGPEGLLPKQRPALP